MSTSCYCSTFGSGSCTTFPGLFPVPVVKPLTSLVPSRVPYWVSHFATTFEVLVTTSLQIGCCCCTSQLLFSVTLGAGLGIESFEHYSIFSLRDYSEGAISWHKIVGDDRKWLCLQELQSQILCVGQFLSLNGILIPFPITVIVHFLRNCVNITRFFFVRISTTRVQRCKEDCLPCFVAFFTTRNLWTTSMKDVLFPVARNRRVPHQFRH